MKRICVWRCSLEPDFWLRKRCCLAFLGLTLLSMAVKKDSSERLNPATHRVLLIAQCNTNAVLPSSFYTSHMITPMIALTLVLAGPVTFQSRWGKRLAQLLAASLRVGCQTFFFFNLKARNVRNTELLFSACYIIFNIASQYTQFCKIQYFFYIYMFF